jgi:glutaredoxin
MTFIVYSKPACPFCDQAKALLKAQGHEFKTLNIDVGQPRVEGETYVAREEFLSSFPGQRTVPLILEGTTKIGGFAELKTYLTEGQREAA